MTQLVFDISGDEIEPVQHAYGAIAILTEIGAYALETCRRRAEREWAKMDVLLPMAPSIYKVADILADPVQLNTNPGRYTNFVNLLDYCAIALPAGFHPDGLPRGVMLVAPAFCDDALAALGQRRHQQEFFGMGGDRRAQS